MVGIRFTNESSPWIEAIKIEMPPLEDESHHKVLTVVVGHRDFGSATAASNRVEALFKPPYLNQVQNVEGERVGTKQTSNLLLLGRNFGSAGTVWFEGTAVDGSDGADGITKWTDGEIMLQVVGLSGNVSVAVGAYETRSIYFDDFSPVLYTASAAFLPDPNGYRTDAKSEFPYSNADDDETLNAGWGAHRNLTLAGLYFGTQVSDLTVTVGDGARAANCEIWPDSLTEVAGVIATDTVRSVTCRVPPGVGLANTVTFKRGAKTSYAANATEVVTLDYLSPTITHLWPRRVHTTGGTATLSGANFGADISRAGAWYGGVKLKLPAASYGHTQVVVNVPAGDGTGQPLTVRVAGQEATVYPSVAAAQAAGLASSAAAAAALGFKYYAPNVTSFEVVGGSASTEGFAVRVQGSDLGRPGSLAARLVRRVGTVDDDAGSRRLAAVEVTATAFAERRLAADDDAYDASEWDELLFVDVAVRWSNHTEALVDVGAGEGSNFLLLNVSGQVTFAPLAYAPPNLTAVAPRQLPTAGGVNVTVRGANFGVGRAFTLRLRGPGRALAHCDFAWDERDLHTAAGGTNPAGTVVAFSQIELKFVSPEGQCDAPMNVTLTVAGQESLQALALSFAAPAILMLSMDGATPLGSDCDRTSAAGCGLLTSGGYTLTATGANFGVDDQQVWVGGEELDASDVAFNSHGEATFTVPAGAGARVPVEVVVGGRRSGPQFFSYDPPYITSFTPNEFDSAKDLIEIYGRNFGSTLAGAGDVRIRVGNATCGPVTIGNVVAELWQTSRAGVPYLWCSIADTTVGTKSLEVFVAGQNVTKSEAESGVRGVCSSGFYGQQAWTVFTDAASECKQACTRAETNAQNPLGRRCTAHYDASSETYVLDASFDEESSECQVFLVSRKYIRNWGRFFRSSIVAPHGPVHLPFPV